MPDIGVAGGGGGVTAAMVTVGAAELDVVSPPQPDKMALSGKMIPKAAILIFCKSPLLLLLRLNRS